MLVGNCRSCEILFAISRAFADDFLDAAGGQAEFLELFALWNALRAQFR